MQDQTNRFPMVLDELKLWQEIRQGDTESFSRFYDHFARDLFRYGYRVCTDKALVQDTIQDLFIHLWMKRGELSEVRTVRFYLYRSLRNRLVRRQDSNRFVLSDDGNFSEEWCSEESDAISSRIEREDLQARLDRLHAAVDSLPLRQQEVIQLRYYHDFSPREIARLMDMNEQSVRNLLCRALRQLRLEIPLFLH